MLAFYLSLIDSEEDKNKFQMIHDLYRNSMLYTATDILKDKYLAEDAVQESFLQIAKNIKNIRTDTQKETKAYVITITRNCSIRMAQKNSKYILMPEKNTLEEIVADSVDYESKAVNLVMYEEMKKALAKLDEKYITPLVLQEQGYKIREIAAALNISESAVKMRISRAKRMIYELLEAKK
ncbi:MAG: RNA polymerase sigma factor [Oscillospiraceae bacterium]|nr:RNA polymerase sigma factor [Oscillospiraceae bacterium]